MGWGWGQGVVLFLLENVASLHFQPVSGVHETNEVDVEDTALGGTLKNKAQ